MDFTRLGMQICICWSQIPLKSGGGGSENQSVSGLTTIWLMQLNTSSWSDCWLWPVECWPTPLQGLCEVPGYWRELEHAVVYVNPDHPKHAQCVTCLVSMEIIEEQGHFQLPEIVYRSLRHGAVRYHVETWWWRKMNGTTMGLRISSRYLCAFKLPSIKCNCVHCP